MRLPRVLLLKIAVDSAHTVDTIGSHAGLLAEAARDAGHAVILTRVDKASPTAFRATFMVEAPDSRGLVAAQAWLENRAAEQSAATGIDVTRVATAA